MGELFNGLLKVIAQALVGLHSLTQGGNSGWSWALAIVMLTVVVRLLLFPLFVKQIKTQRAMAQLQPKIKELQARHKGDRETLNQELMKLYKEHGANPLAGCLPLLLQAPIFIAMYQVLRQLGPTLSSSGALTFPNKFGVSPSVAESLGEAKIFGAPIAGGFTSDERLLQALNSNALTVKIVATLLIVAMAGTTFITSRQMMAKNGPADAQQAMQQKILLYVMPVMLALFGFGVAIGTLIYWTTTNVFTMAQQFVIIRRLGPAPYPTAPVGKAGTGSAPVSSSAGGKATTKKPANSSPAKPAAAAGEDAAPAHAAAATTASARRPNQGRSNKRGKGQRRGGRR